jgi:hypothetical protein
LTRGLTRGFAGGFACGFAVAASGRAAGFGRAGLGALLGWLGARNCSLAALPSSLFAVWFAVRFAVRPVCWQRRFAAPRFAVGGRARA